MREIKFRGLRTDGGGWVEGCLIQPNNIFNTLSGMVKVHTETIGQFTGLKDKNGREIFEGDLIEGITYSGLTNKSYVKYDSEYGCWQLQTVSDKTLSFPINAFNETIEIIGNIHEKTETK